MRKTESRRRRTEDGGQRSVVGSQWSEGGKNVRQEWTKQEALGRLLETRVAAPNVAGEQFPAFAPCPRLPPQFQAGTGEGGGF